MKLNRRLVAAGLFPVAVGLRAVSGSSLSARIGFGLLVVGALGVSVAGVFREFIPHSIGSAIGLPGIVMAALILSWRFRHAKGWQPIQTVTLLSALGMLVALLSVIMDVGMPGLQQRIFLFLVLLWLSVVVHQLFRLTRNHGAVSEPTEPRTTLLPR